MMNRDKLASMYYEACEIEGVLCSDFVAKITAELFDPFTLQGIINWMTIYDKDDPLGIVDRKFSGAEVDFFATLDNFISMGRYTAEDRVYVVENNRITPVIAEAAAKLISSGK